MSTTTPPNEKAEPVVLPVDLRDYFAAKAMQALSGTEQGMSEAPSHIAKCAYQMADAMLKVRQNGGAA